VVQSSSSISRINSIILKDINKDNVLELIAGTSGGLVVYKNSGNGSFSLSEKTPERIWINSIALDDINGDSAIECICGNNGFNYIYVYEEKR
jgi:hypothetical protein